jgi:hypothetical protein
VGNVIDSDRFRVIIVIGVAQTVVIAVGAWVIVVVEIERKLDQAVTLIKLRDDVLGEPVLPVGLLLGAEIAPVGGTLERLDLAEEIWSKELVEERHLGVSMELE